MGVVMIPATRPYFDDWVWCSNVMPETSVRLRHIAAEHNIDIKLSLKAVNRQGIYEPRLIGIYCRNVQVYRWLIDTIIIEGYSIGRYRQSVRLSPVVEEVTPASTSKDGK